MHKEEHSLLGMRRHPSGPHKQCKGAAGVKNTEFYEMKCVCAGIPGAEIETVCNCCL